MRTSAICWSRSIRAGTRRSVAASFSSISFVAPGLSSTRQAPVGRRRRSLPWPPSRCGAELAAALPPRLAPSAELLPLLRELAVHLRELRLLFARTWLRRDDSCRHLVWSLRLFSAVPRPPLGGMVVRMCGLLLNSRNFATTTSDATTFCRRPERLPRDAAGGRALGGLPSSALNF